NLRHETGAFLRRQRGESGAHNVEPPRIRKSLGKHLSDQQRISRGPGLWLVLQNLKLRRKTLRVECCDISIHSIRVGLEHSTRLRRSFGKFNFYFLRESERAMLFVLFEYRIAQDLSKLAAFVSPQQIHLPKAVTRDHVSLGKIQIRIVLCFNVGDTALVA